MSYRPPVLRVVVIDDHVDTRQLMAAYLTINLPDRVRVHSLGDTEYRDGVDWDDVVVAIVDVMMPIVDGRDVLRWLRDEMPTVYRIAWTAAAEEVRQEIAQEQLAHACIAKPGLVELLEFVAPLVSTRERK